MWRLLALLGLGLMAVVVQSMAASVLPGHAVPDLGLLVVVAVALHASAFEGLAVAASVGYGADLLSGSLLGHHALLRILTFLAARLVSGQFHLKRASSVAVLVFGLSVADALGTVAVLWLFTGRVSLGLAAGVEIAVRALVNALFAPLVAGAVAALVERFTERSRRRRDVHLDTRRPAL